MRINLEPTESQISTIERIKEDLGIKTNTKLFIALIEAYDENKQTKNAFKKLTKYVTKKATQIE